MQSIAQRAEYWRNLSLAATVTFHASAVTYERIIMSQRHTEKGCFAITKITWNFLTLHLPAVYRQSRLWNATEMPVTADSEFAQLELN